MSWMNRGNTKPTINTIPNFFEKSRKIGNDDQYPPICHNHPHKDAHWAEELAL